MNEVTSKTIDFSVFGSDYWKPEDDKDYIVELGNARIVQKSFKDKPEPRPVLVHDVFSVNDERFAKPKLFETGSRTFIDAVKPIIQSGKERYTLVLRRKNGKEYTVTDYAQIQRLAGRTA